MKDIKQLDLSNKKYIIFDLDGTLIDSIGVWNRTDQEVIERYGGTIVSLDVIQRDRDTFTDNHLDSDVYLAYCEYLIDKYNLTIKDANKLLKIRWEKSGEILEKETDFKPNVVKLIFKLKKLGFTLVLATMTTQVQLDIYAKRNKKMLSKMNIEEVFDLIIRKEDVKNKKPHPEIYTKIMQYYEIVPDECLVFEDSYTGVLACNRAGIECVNIYDKYADIDREKIEAITDYKIKDYEEMLRVVDFLAVNEKEKNVA